MELAGPDVAANGFEAALDRSEIRPGKQSDGIEHGGVGDRPKDVVLRQAVIERERFDKLHRQRILCSANARLPGFI